MRLWHHPTSLASAMATALVRFLLLAVTVYLLCGASTALPTLHREGGAETMVGWQPNPNRRGTLDIIFNCLFTIVACTWSVQHFNLPVPKDGFWTLFLRRARWFALAIIFPEVLLLQAVAERYTATMCRDKFGKIEGIHVVCSSWIARLKKRWKKSGDSDVEISRRTTGEQRQDLLPPTDVDFTLVHAHYAAMGGFRLLRTNGSESSNGKDRSRSRSLLDANDDSTVLNAMQLANGQLRGLIPPFPMPSTEEIKDMSKSNAFTKVVALIQICGLLASVIARGCEGLAVSQSEIITLAFVGCTLLTYGFWWYKPQDVDTPILIAAPVQDEPCLARSFGLVLQSGPRPPLPLAA